LRYAGASIALNIALSLLLFFPAGLGYLGIAIATTLASTVNAALLGFTLRRRNLLRFDRRLLRRAPRIALASVVMGLCLFLASTLWPEGASLLRRVLALAGLVGLGLATYALACVLTGAAAWRDMRRALAAGAKG
jgi:putative peptidoglycan lipid II flippase